MYVLGISRLRMYDFLSLLVQHLFTIILTHTPECKQHRKKTQSGSSQAQNSTQLCNIISCDQGGLRSQDARFSWCLMARPITKRCFPHMCVSRQARVPFAFTSMFSLGLVSTIYAHGVDNQSRWH